LQGKVPYVDMYDSNPPLIYYLDTVPALVARVFHIPPVLSFSLFIWLLSALCSAASFYLVTKYARQRDLPALLSLVVGFALFSLALGGDYGQREHICVICFMPFFILRWFRWTNRPIAKRDAVIAGAVAGIGICLKHYFLLIVVAVELFWMLDKRRWRPVWAPEAVAAVIMGLVYLGHFLLVPSGMRDGYFQFMVPVYSAGYGFWDTNLINLLCAPENKSTFTYLPLACLAGLIFARRNSYLLALVIYTLAGTVIYMIQHKGWHYHSFPALSGVFLLFGMIGGITLTLLNRLFVLPKYCLLALAAVLAVPFLIANAVSEFIDVTNQPQFEMAKIGYEGKSPLWDLGPFSDTILDNTRIGDPVLFFSNAVRPEYPISLQLERRPGSRHLHAIPLSLFLYIAELNPASKLLKYEPIMIRQYEEDVHNIRPKLIFIQEFPIRASLDKSPYHFEDTQLGDYDKIGNELGFEVFKLKEQQNGS
jgi:hypothetical protein